MEATPIQLNSKHMMRLSQLEETGRLCQQQSVRSLIVQPEATAIIIKKENSFNNG
jgi:hypothetical protein